MDLESQTLRLALDKDFSYIFMGQPVSGDLMARRIEWSHIIMETTTHATKVVIYIYKK